VTVTGEAEWDTREQALMLALMLYRSQCCPSGHYMPAAGAKADEYAWTATAIRCHVCTAVAMEATRVGGNPHSSAMQFQAKRRG